ncbi:hypothetical protein A374_07216 [Fictibacillus macauensis ZFHKF-1]|uniref:Uncharacterized protein n=1 Tax=Fictibacillus macauensis ZFHKF-1 TaxID=1196324 RepID=I8J2W5_9BACL|nr:hypothetical protein [Fictibacillus macauensis]EIT86091.1 hypothetical protein A374_07216 [Fictibacillus macauensis ZFHKF-1]
MKGLTSLFIVYYALIVGYIGIIDQESSVGSLLKLAIVLAGIMVLVVWSSFMLSLLYHEQLRDKKKRMNVIFFSLYSEGFLFMMVIPYTYKHVSPLILLLILFGLFTVNYMLWVSVVATVKQRGLSLNVSLWRIVKMGEALEHTALISSMTTLDRLSYVFAVACAIVEDSVFFSSIVVGILLLSIKPVRRLEEMTTFGVVVHKEYVVAKVMYYSVYLFTIGWHLYFPNLTTFLIGVCSILALKLCMGKVMEDTYHKVQRNEI